MPDGNELDPAAYRASIEAERARRNDGLRDPLSWLSLVGLHWLHDGTQSFGSGPAVEIVLHAGAGEVPDRAGSLEVVDDRVLVHPAAAATLTIDGEPCADGTELADDRDGSPTVLELASLRLHVIRRGSRLALRVRDTEAAALRAFTGVRCFEVDPAWRLVGRLLPSTPGSTIPVPDVIGDVNDEATPGTVELLIDGQTHRLHALESEPGHLWLVFADTTNGVETYGGGQFLVTGPVQADGSVEVDFNLAYNPPCVFSPYATCPLPPAGNRLPVRIAAGERA